MGHSLTLKHATWNEMFYVEHFRVFLKQREELHIVTRCRRRTKNMPQRNLKRPSRAYYNASLPLQSG